MKKLCKMEDLTARCIRDLCEEIEPLEQVGETSFRYRVPMPPGIGDPAWCIDAANAAEDALVQKCHERICCCKPDFHNFGFEDLQREIRRMVELYFDGKTG